MSFGVRDTYIGRVYHVGRARKCTIMHGRFATVGKADDMAHQLPGIHHEQYIFR